jgi:hypothetical protein
MAGHAHGVLRPLLLPLLFLFFLHVVPGYPRGFKVFASHGHTGMSLRLPLYSAAVYSFTTFALHLPILFLFATGLCYTICYILEIVDGVFMD